jgi:hypothetical protein
MGRLEACGMRHPRGIILGLMPNPDTVYVVTGLPRSGTSMLMRMLNAGGMPVLRDESRSPDAHNPHGYFEYEAVRRIHEDASWLPAARGKAIKVVAPLLRHLPSHYRYAAIFMRRPLSEIIISQARMLGRKSDGDPGLQHLLASELNQVLGWLGLQTNWRVLCLDYHAVLREPETAAGQISDFIGQLDPAAMARAVDPALYRSRSTPVPPE